MLTIFIPGQEDLYNEQTNEFVTLKETRIQMEHSLISLRKWESKWHKPFLNNKDRSPEETLDYIRCMTLTTNVDPMVYRFIPETEMIKISEYIKDPMTATWFGANDKNGTSPKHSVITAEVIYYWMIELGVPIELEKWHLNQLLTLIRVINVERTPKKKGSSTDTLRRYAEINRKRRAAMNTRG